MNVPTSRSIGGTRTGSNPVDRALVAVVAERLRRLTRTDYCFFFWFLGYHFYMLPQLSAEFWEQELGGGSREYVEPLSTAGPAPL